MQLGGGLDLDDDGVVHDHVESLPADLHSLVADGALYLEIHHMPTAPQFYSQRADIDLLEEAESEVVVDLEEPPDHRVRKSFKEELALRHPRGSPLGAPSHHPSRPALIRVIRAIRVIEVH